MSNVNNLSMLFFDFEALKDGPSENSNFLLTQDWMEPMVTNGSETSQTAANTIVKKRTYGKLMAAALDHINNASDRGLTRGELCLLLDRPQNSLTAALKQLEKMGLIVKSGSTRIWIPSGHSQSVYHAKRYL